MGLFDSDETISTRITATQAHEKAKDNRQELRGLERRVEKLEEYLGLEWSESNDKYYNPTLTTKDKVE